jgi:hypothetical protein
MDFMNRVGLGNGIGVSHASKFIKKMESGWLYYDIKLTTSDNKAADTEAQC